MENLELPLTSEEQRQKNLEALEKLRPLDDTFMREMFRNDLELAQYMLRIILSKPDLILTKEETQYDMQHLFGSRSITLDVFGVDSAGKQYDCEVQKADDGANPKRARYHSAAMDVDNLKVREDFKHLPDTYVIFFTENDIFKKGKPIYRIERIILDSDEPFDDGEHILYINGAYCDESDTSDLAKLIHDFRCSKSSDMLLNLFAGKTRFLKETQEGVERMCKVMEERIKDNERRLLNKIAVDLLRLGNVTKEQIAEITGLSLETINEIETNLNNIPA